MSSTSQSPNWREIISARSTITGKQEYLTSTNGVLNVSGGGSGGSVTITSPIGQTTKSASVSVTLASDQGTLNVADSAAESSLSMIATNTSGLATTANQTNGTQKTQVTSLPSIPAGSNAIGSITNTSFASTQSGAWTVQPGNTANTTPWLVNAGLNPSGTLVNTFSIHLTSNTTTTPTSATAYISSIAISNEVAGTTSAITIQDKQGTPLKLVNGIATTVLTTAPTIINFQTPVKMVSGIDIITSGAVAATVDVWVNYYQ